MGRVLISVILEKVFGRPPLISGLTVEEPVIDAVVRVCTVAMYDLPKKPEPLHIQCGKVILPEAPVLKHHAWYPSFLRGFNKLPCIFNCKGCRHFDSRICPFIHSFNCNCGMRIPVGCYNNCICLLLIQ